MGYWFQVQLDLKTRVILSKGECSEMVQEWGGAWLRMEGYKFFEWCQSWKTRCYKQERQCEQNCRSRSEYGIDGVQRSGLHKADIAGWEGEEIRLVWSMESNLGGLCCQAEFELTCWLRGLLSRVWPKEHGTIWTSQFPEAHPGPKYDTGKIHTRIR